MILYLFNDCATLGNLAREMVGEVVLRCIGKTYHDYALYQKLMINKDSLANNEIQT